MQASAESDKMSLLQAICTIVVSILAIIGYFHFVFRPIPELVEISVPSEANEGESKSLLCMVNKMSSHYSLLWSFNSDDDSSQWQIISYDENVMANKPVCASNKPKYDLVILDHFDDGIFLYKLTINCLSQDDTGRYRCSVPVSNTDKKQWPQKLSHMEVRAYPVIAYEENNEEDNMTWEKFNCVLKCLGGPAAIGLSGVLALISLVYFALPALGFSAAGVVAASIAAKLMAWYKGSIAAGSLISILQSIGAAGVGWKAILSAMFGPTAVAAALQGRCGC